MPSIDRGTTRKHIAEHLTEAIAAQPHRPPHGWQRRAACLGIDATVFLPDHEGPPQRQAIAYCADCPVRVDCATEHAAEPHGIWGGISSTGRKQLRRAIYERTGTWPSLPTIDD